MSNHIPPAEPSEITYEQYYNHALEEVGDLTPYIALTEELFILAREGKINDIRRKLLVFTQTTIDTAVEQAEQRGRAIGQYQAADKLYGDVCHIYMFGDNNSSAKAKSISEWSAVGLLKDCEAFMNDNRNIYAEYLKRLTPPPVEQGDDKPQITICKRCGEEYDTFHSCSKPPVEHKAEKTAL